MERKNSYNTTGTKSPAQIEVERTGCLASLLRNTGRLYLDACSIMESSDGAYGGDGDSFFRRLETLLPSIQRERYGDSGEHILATTESVVAEVIGKATNRDGKATPEQIKAGQVGVDRIHRLLSLNLLTIYRDMTTDGHGDRSLMAAVVNAGRMSIAVITQDRNLAAGLENLNGTACTHIDVHVYRIDRFGFPGRHIAPQNAAQTSPKYVAAAAKRDRGTIDRFSLMDCALPQKADAVLASGEDYYPGDRVQLADDTSLYLGEELGSGSEATVFVLDGDAGSCVKILKAPSLYKQAKVILLTKRTFDIPGVAFPEEAVYDREKHFIGYRMKRVPNSVSLNALFSAQGRRRYASGLDRRDYVRIALKLATLIQQVHARGILLADVSGSNVRVSVGSDGQVGHDPNLFLIDLDSAQIGFDGTVYPADGVTADYAAPELQESLRGGWKAKAIDLMQERFSVTTLLGQIVLCGVHPFCSVNGEEQEDEIRDHIARRELPFGRNEHRTGYAPGLGSLIWSNLPGSFKTMLSGALTCDADKRPGLTELINQLAHYDVWINDPDNRKHYSQITSLTPTRLKEYYGTCSCCGRTFDSNAEGVRGKSGETLCGQCAGEVVARCEVCGEPTLTRGEQIMGGRVHRLCRSCFEKARSGMPAAVTPVIPVSPAATPQAEKDPPRRSGWNVLSFWKKWASL